MNEEEKLRIKKWAMKYEWCETVQFINGCIVIFAPWGEHRDFASFEQLRDWAEKKV